MPLFTFLVCILFIILIIQRKITQELPVPCTAFTAYQKNVFLKSALARPGGKRRKAANSR